MKSKNSTQLNAEQRFDVDFSNPLLKNKLVYPAFDNEQKCSIAAKVLKQDHIAEA